MREDKIFTLEEKEVNKSTKGVNFRNMFPRLVIKVLLIIAIGLIQSTGIYTIQPPEILAFFGHFIFPASLFFLFSPEVIEVSDFKKVIGEIPFRILTLVTTALSLLPVVFIRKFIFLEYNHLDSIPLKFGFTLFRSYSTEEKLDYLNNLLLNIGGQGLFNDQEKLLLATQSTGIKNLQDNLTQLILAQQEQLIKAKNSAAGLTEMVSVFMNDHPYIYTAAIVVGAVLTVYFIYSHQNNILSLYQTIFNKSNEKEEKIMKALEAAEAIIKKDSRSISQLRNALINLAENAKEQDIILEQMMYLTAITPEDIVSTKHLFDNLAKGTLKFCNCANAKAVVSESESLGITLGDLAKGETTTSTTSIIDSLNKD